MTRSKKTYKSFPGNGNCSPTKRRMMLESTDKDDRLEADDNLEELCRDFSRLGVLEDERQKSVYWSVTYEQNSKSTQTINTYETFFDNKSTQTRQELSPEFCYQDVNKTSEKMAPKLDDKLEERSYEPSTSAEPETGYQLMFKLVDRRNTERGHFNPYGRYLRPRGNLRGLTRPNRRGPRGRGNLRESPNRFTTRAEIHDQTPQIKNNDKKNEGQSGPFMTPDQYRDWISQPF